MGGFMTASEAGVAGSNAAAGLEESHGLCPIEDRRRIDSTPEGMLDGFSLGNYLIMVDYTWRLVREGKATIWRAVVKMLEQIDTTTKSGQALVQKLSRGRLLGRFFAASRQSVASRP
jgi:hypothetical protein